MHRDGNHGTAPISLLARFAAVVQVAAAAVLILREPFAFPVIRQPGRRMRNRGGPIGEMRTAEAAAFKAERTMASRIAPAASRMAGYATFPPRKAPFSREPRDADGQWPDAGVFIPRRYEYIDWPGEPGGTRTHGPKIKSLVLYQLSYGLTQPR